MSEVQQTQSLEWINGNMHRNYPLVDSAVPKAQSGEYLPASFLVDLQLIVPYVEGLDASRFFVSSVVRHPASFQVTIGYMINPNTGTGFDCAMSAMIPLDTQFRGTSEPFITDLAAITSGNPAITRSSYTSGIPDEYAPLKQLRGKLYIGSCVDILGIGELSFTYAATALLARCIYIETPAESISSVRFIDDYGTDRTFTDDITIRADAGVIVDVEGTTITFKLDPAYLDTEVKQVLAEAYGAAIKSINGATPDETGDFRITGQDCTLLSTQTNSISISNPCAKPCCDNGGTDTAEIQTALEGLEQAKTVLNNYYTDLATKVNSMQSRLASLIASRN